MKIGDPILFRELPLIQKIIQDETWLEGERRGCHVGSDDQAVRDKVCEIILRIGQQLRDSVHATVSHSRDTSSAAVIDAASVCSPADSKANEAA